mgnify:FL=1
MAYSKETYKKAEQELAQRRNRALAEREEHHRIAVEAVPEILEVEERMSSAGLATIKALGMGAADAKEYIKKLSKINLSTQAQRKLLLKNGGFPVDWLDVRYSCKKCEDKGYVNGLMCDCFKELLTSIEYEKLCSKLPVNDCRFENFKLDYYPDGVGTSPRKRMESVLNYCKTYAVDFNRKSSSLLLYGHTGLGKTHLSLAIAGRVVEAGYGVIYSSAQNLFNKLEKEKFGRSDGNTEENILNCDLLIIDDLGAEFTTQFTISSLYNIVNSRGLEDKSTIISTNLSPEQLLSTYSERIASRILNNYTLLRFDGTDIRQIKTR